MKHDADDLTLDAEIVREAREKKADRNTIKIACAVFTGTDGRSRIAYPNLEHGDGEGTRETKDFIKTGRQFLQPGEFLQFRLVNVTIEEMGV